MSVIRQIGIDFGTSTTVLRFKDYLNGKDLKVDQAPEQLVYENKPTIPTIIFETIDGEFLFGEEAEHYSGEGELHRNFKMNLISDNQVVFDKTTFLILHFLKFLRSVYTEQIPTFGNVDDEYTHISYPAKWPDHVIDCMLKMAELAGFKNVKGVDEPTAAINSAIYQYGDYLEENDMMKMHQESNLLMIDMGAGTTDLVYCKFTPGETNTSNVVMSWPSKESHDYFGGREFDERLTGYCVNYLNDYGYDYSNRKHLLERNVKRWKEGEFSKVLNKNKKLPGKPSFIVPIINSNENYEFMVSSRSSFEGLVGDILSVFPKIINDFHQELKKQGDHNLYRDTDLIILTGGNCQWYFINEYLLGLRSEEVAFEKINKNKILMMSRPQETVAFGLTLRDSAIYNIKDTDNAPFVLVNPTSSIKLGDRNYQTIVAQHAFGAASAGVAGGWVPGAGGVAALAVSSGFVYSMYFRLSKGLGIELSRNTLKIISSVVLAQVGAAAVAYLGTASVISFVPGLGTVGSILLVSGMNYAAVNIAALIFGNVVKALMDNGKNIAELSDDEIKELARQEISKIDIKEFISNSQKEFKKKKKSGEFDAAQKADVIRD